MGALFRFARGVPGGAISNRPFFSSTSIYSHAMRLSIVSPNDESATGDDSHIGSRVDNAIALDIVHK